MNRRSFLSAAFAAASLPANTASSRRPNILLMLADDLTWNLCEPYGSREVRTPNLARLAKQGICLDRMFTSTAMCSPTRQQLYTGLYPVRNGAYPNHSRVHDGVRGFPHHFRKLGYRVGLNGKLHIGPDESFPFETVGKRGQESAPGDVSALADFIGRDGGQPWFLTIASHQPHAPWDKGNAAEYPPEKLTVPLYLVDCPATREGLSRCYAEITYLDRQVGDVLDAIERSGQADNTIVIFTSEQGAQFPFVKWTCYENGLKTAFIVRWPGKIKAGTRTKALAQYVDVAPTLLEAAGADPEKFPPGRADAKGDTGFDGRSFLPVLLGKTNRHRDYVYGVHTTRGIIGGNDCYPVRSVRDARWKYIRNLKHDQSFSNVLTTRKDGHIRAWLEWGQEHPDAKKRAEAYLHRPAEELYDLDSDPHEMNNLAGDVRLARVKAGLARRIDTWMAQQGDRGIETEMQAESRRLAGREE